MKFFKIAALATVASLGLASMPASAATINLSAVGTGAVNNQSAPVDQVAATLNVNVGAQVDSAVDQSATAASNVASIDVAVAQTATGVVSGNASLVEAGALNLSLDSVDQNVYAINGAGALLNSDVTQVATAATNVGSIDVSVKQN